MAEWLGGGLQNLLQRFDPVLTPLLNKQSLYAEPVVKLLFIYLLIFASSVFVAGAQNNGQAPRVLVVMAHPDDESTFSVTLYKIAKELNGTVDLFTITNGEAGYKYSTLAEKYYHCDLTDEKEGRSNLPAIRKKELQKAGNILGVSHYYFLNQQDAHYGLDEKEPLDSSWNVPLLKRKLNQVLSKGHYDFVFCLLPDPATHGEHKAATLLALDVLANLPENTRPVILGAITSNKTDSTTRFSQLKDYKQTQTTTDGPLYNVDRTTGFSYKNRINYKIIANWELAEHKSQGVTQMTMNDGDLEQFWYFELNGKDGLAKCVALFNQLKQVPYISKTY